MRVRVTCPGASTARNAARLSPSSAERRASSAERVASPQKTAGGEASAPPGFNLPPSGCNTETKAAELRATSDMVSPSPVAAEAAPVGAAADSAAAMEWRTWARVHTAYMAAAPRRFWSRSWIWGPPGEGVHGRAVSGLGFGLHVGPAWAEGIAKDVNHEGCDEVKAEGDDHSEKETVQDPIDPCVLSTCGRLDVVSAWEQVGGGLRFKFGFGFEFGLGWGEMVGSVAGTCDQVDMIRIVHLLL
jgi:hypothetical protein